MHNLAIKIGWECLKITPYNIGILNWGHFIAEKFQNTNTNVLNVRKVEIHKRWCII